MTISTVPRVARSVRHAWDRLRACGPPAELFDLAMLVDLPEPARRWLTRAIAPGTPLWQSVELAMHGEIRLGRWRGFTANQVAAPPLGYIWAARTRIFGVPVVGYDRLSSGTAQMRWRLLSLVPVMTAQGPDITRSAAGRLASEFVLVPTSFRAATWRLGDRPDTAVATWRIGAEHVDVEVHVGPEGQLLDVLLQRWSNPGGEPYGYHPFGVTVEAERTFAGITIPSTLRAGWWWGTDRQNEGEFFRAHVTNATFRP
ncbi:MAG: DUF6544 family protein [Pseudonocardiales bacterium]